MELRQQAGVCTYIRLADRSAPAHPLRAHNLSFCLDQLNPTPLPNDPTRLRLNPFLFLSIYFTHNLKMRSIEKRKQKKTGSCLKLIRYPIFLKRNAVVRNKHVNTKEL